MYKNTLLIKNKKGKIFLIKIGNINHYHQSFLIPVFAYEPKVKTLKKLLLEKPIPFNEEIGRIVINANDPTAEIIEFKVRNDFRNQGLGRLMLELGESILQEITSVQAITAVPISEPYPDESNVLDLDLMEIYRKLGFQSCSKENNSNTEKMLLKF